MHQAFWVPARIAENCIKLVIAEERPAVPHLDFQHTVQTIQITLRRQHPCFNIGRESLLSTL